MTKRELIKYLKEEIKKLPTDYYKLYDAETIEEGIDDCLGVGKRKGYEHILMLLTIGKEQNNERAKRKGLF